MGVSMGYWCSVSFSIIFREYFIPSSLACIAIARNVLEFGELVYVNTL